MSELVFGIKHIRDDVPVQSALGADMSVIGLGGTAPGADASYFPLGKRVYFLSSDTAYRTALGTSGTLPEALDLISAQLNGGAARIVLVRSEVGANDSATIANIIGSEAAGTGVWSFLGAPEEFGVTPRLFCFSGWTERTESGVDKITVTNGGAGYTSAPAVALSGGGAGATAVAEMSNGISIAITNGGSGYTTAPTLSIEAPPPGGVQATATCVVTAGAITAINVTNPGYGYTSPPVVTVTGAGTGAVLAASLTGRVRSVSITNSGSGYNAAPTVAFSGGGGAGAVATATFAQVGNAICAVMPTILERLKGVLVPDGPTDRQTWLNWVETLPRTARILHPLAQKAKVLDSAGQIKLTALSPAIVGRYVARDSEFDGRPFHSVANQPVNGIVGVSPAIQFSITDDSSLGQDYLFRSGGIVVRGETGVESAIGEGGFAFVGTDTMSADSNYLFANVTRGRDYIELTQLKALRYYLGRFNITVQTVQAVINTMEQHLSQLRADRDILDYRIVFEKDRNSPGELRLGNLDVTFKAEEPPVLRKIIIRSRRHADALNDLTQQISLQLSAAAA